MPEAGPAAGRPDVDADSARTVVMAPVRDERRTMLVGAARPSVPVPLPLARLLD